MNLDKHILKLIKDNPPDYPPLELIQALSSDEDKISLLPLFEDDKLKYEIILTFSSDESKIKCLSFIKNDYYKANNKWKIICYQ